MSDSVVSTGGSFYRRMRAGIALSEAKRVAAHDTAEAVREQARRTYMARVGARKVPPNAVARESTAEDAVDNDHMVKSYIAGEQWGARLATMYGIAHMADVSDESLRLQRRVVAQNDQIIALLGGILAALHSASSE